MTATLSKDQFIDIYNKYNPEIVEYCYNHSPDKAHVQELAEHVFLKAWEQISCGAVVEDMRVFLYGIAHSLITEKQSLYRDIMAFSIFSSNRVIKHNTFAH